MFELVAMILLAIFTVMMAGFGVGKMVKLKDVAGKAVGAYVVAKAAKKVLEGKGIDEKYIEEFADATTSPGGYVVRGTADYLLGKERSAGVRGLYGSMASYLETGKMPKSYESAIDFLKGKKPAKQNPEKKKLVKYKIMDYAAEHGYDPAKVSVSFDQGLGGGKAYGHFTLKGTDDLSIEVAENEDTAFQAAIGYHEVKESKLKSMGLYRPGYAGEAKTNVEVLDDLMKNPKENLPEIIALLYYHYRPSTDIGHIMAVQEAKRISPHMRDMLTDESMKKILDNYGKAKGDISGFSS